MATQSGREVKFTQVLDKLTKWRHELVDQMRNPSTNQYAREEVLKLKVQLDQAIGCLQLCERYQILLSSKVTEIPLPKHGHLSEYHLMEDCESAERDYWIEVEVNGKPVQPSSGSLIIEKSQVLPEPRFTHPAKSEDSGETLLVQNDKYQDDR
jgi:hypothetical protein